MKILKNIRQCLKAKAFRINYRDHHIDDHACSSEKACKNEGSVRNDRPGYEELLLLLEEQIRNGDISIGANTPGIPF